MKNELVEFMTAIAKFGVLGRWSFGNLLEFGSRLSMSVVRAQPLAFLYWM